MPLDRRNIKTIEKDEEYLRQVSKEVDFETDDVKDIVSKIKEICNCDVNIMALASVQIGIPLRLIYLRKTKQESLEEENYDESKVLINPVVVNSEGLTWYWEACASCLDNTGLVPRPYRIQIEYFDVNGNKCEETFEELAATVLSHELDHLDGILHIDIATEILMMNKDQRKELRKQHPYKIDRKDGPYKINKIKRLKR
jgi:peptide deformylase